MGKGDKKGGDDKAMTVTEKLLQVKGSKSVGWLKDRIESLEADFVQFLLQSAIFTGDCLSAAECKLMDDILELKDWINELLEEEKKA